MGSIRKRASTIIVAFFSVIGSASVVLAQEIALDAPVLEARLLPEDGGPGVVATGERFGISVRALEDEVLISSRRGTHTYTFNGEQWIESSDLFPQTIIAADESRFFTQGNYPPSAGTILQSGVSRAIYVFARGDERYPIGHALQTVVPDDTSRIESIDVRGTLMAVGTLSDRVHVFEFTGEKYILMDVLEYTVDQYATNFGADVRILEDEIIVAAPGSTENGVRLAGSIHVFRRQGSSWERTQKILDDPQTPNFGEIFDAGKDFIVAGRSYQMKVYGRTEAGWQIRSVIDAPITQTGVTARFERIDIEGSQMLAIAVDLLLYSNIGDNPTITGTVFDGSQPGMESVDLAGGRAFVGVPGGNYPRTRTAGAVLELEVSDEGGLSLAHVVEPAVGSSRNQFGSAVRVSNGDLLVYAESSQTASSRESGAFAYSQLGGKWRRTAQLTGPAGEIVGSPAATWSDTSIAWNFRTGAFFLHVQQGDRWLPSDVVKPTVVVHPEEVVMENDTIAVGGRTEPFGRAVEIVRFREGAWETEEVLTGTGDVEFRFGGSLSLSDGRLLVGNPSFSPLPVLVFENFGSRWVQTHEIGPGDVMESARNFGSSVLLDGERMFIGVERGRETINSPRRGHVYYYELRGDEWSLIQVLQDPDSTDFDYFGSAMALHGDRLLVDAQKANRAYLFRWVDGHWIQIDKLSKPRAGPGSVALTSTHAFLGNPEDNARGNNTGSVSVFTFALPEDLSGPWYVPGQSGHGWILETLPPTPGSDDYRLNAYWYVYHEGMPLWLTGTGTFDGSRVEMDVFAAEGSGLPPDFVAEEFTLVPWGKLTFCLQCEPDGCRIVGAHPAREWRLC